MIDDRLSDADLAAHGVDRDHRTGELASLGQRIEQVRDGGDLVGFLGHRELGQG